MVEQWQPVLNALGREGAPFLRSDAYHANWGTGEGRARRFFTDGYGLKLTRWAVSKLENWHAAGRRVSPKEFSDSLEEWLHTAEAGPYRGLSLEFSAIVASFDMSAVVPRIVDSDGEVGFGPGARAGLKTVPDHGRTLASRALAIFEDLLGRNEVSLTIVNSENRPQTIPNGRSM